MVNIYFPLHESLQSILPAPNPLVPDTAFLTKLNKPLDADIIRLKRRYEPESPDPPNILFSPQWNNGSLRGIRFVAKNDAKTMLAFIDGAVSSAGSDDQTLLGGYSVIFAPKTWTPPAYAPLAVDGNPHTTTRVELVAAIAALKIRRWNGEGFERIVLATSSPALVDGITTEIYRWKESQWKRGKGKGDVKCRELWEELLEQVEACGNRGLLVQFWLIQKEWNETREYAKAAAACPAKERTKEMDPNLFLLFERSSEYGPKADLIIGYPTISQMPEDVARKLVKELPLREVVWDKSTTVLINKNSARLRKHS